MFASYVSEASPGCRYVLGARVHLSGAGARERRDGRDGHDGHDGHDKHDAGATAPDLLHILSIIAHPVQ